jgi:enhancing lycopene biosynthesis protein 2
MARVAVVLSGCGVFDGAEIYESVLTLLRLDEKAAQVQCFAPNIDQAHVINHLSGEVSEGETRNVLVEAARLVRGEIKDLVEANAADFDALIVPGGFGAAKNLSSFAFKGPECEINAEFLALARDFRAQNKPIGLVCIAPVMAAAIAGEGAQCTIGNDAETAGAIGAMGGEHQDCAVNDIVIDESRKLVTTPAYMLANSISEASQGITRLVDAVLAMA